WSSDVCSSDLRPAAASGEPYRAGPAGRGEPRDPPRARWRSDAPGRTRASRRPGTRPGKRRSPRVAAPVPDSARSTTPTGHERVDAESPGRAGGVVVGRGVFGCRSITEVVECRHVELL